MVFGYVVAVSATCLGAFALVLGLMGVAMDGWPSRRKGVPEALNVGDSALLFGGAVLLVTAAVSAIATVALTAP